MEKKSKDLAEIDAKLEQLLDRYELGAVVDAYNNKYKYNTAKIHIEQKPRSSSLNSAKLFDTRVQDLWAIVERLTDINRVELEDIKQQLLEQDAQCREYADLIAKNKQHEDERSNHIHDVDAHDEHANITRSVKALNQRIEHTFDSLRSRLSDHTKTASENPFRSVRVRKLWMRAKAAAEYLVPNELDAIRSELRHLDRLGDEAEYRRQHLDDHAATLEALGDTSNDVHGQRMNEEYERLMRKLKKLELYVADKLTQPSAIRHSEL